ncbi:MAG: hypothetical protein R3F36_12895 [Candidatus Competibacteraceae bacterium]
MLNLTLPVVLLIGTLLVIGIPDTVAADCVSADHGVAVTFAIAPSPSATPNKWQH